MKAAGAARDLQRVLNPTPRTRAQDPPSSMPHLPPLEIPKFSGRMEDWTSFNEIFNTSIHNNQQLDSITKLRYLKSFMESGPNGPLHLINGFELITGSYEKARDLLKSRYEHKRSTVDKWIKTIYDLPYLKEESKEGLIRMIDTTSTALQSLEVLKISTAGWDPLIVFHLRLRLDPQTRKEWEMTRDDNEPQPLDVFVRFVNQKAAALDSPSRSTPQNSNWSSRPDNRNNNNRGGTQSTQSSHPSSSQSRSPPSRNCQFCDQTGHLNYLCPKFKALTVPARKNLVRQKAACVNCLVKTDPPHTAETCRSRKCNRCDGKHHSLLHMDSPASHVAQPQPPAQSVPPKQTNLTSCDQRHTRVKNFPLHSSGQSNDSLKRT
jgi:Protein of unknown function (DUF1759)